MPTANDFFNNFTPGLFSGVASGLVLALFFLITHKFQSKLAAG